MGLFFALFESREGLTGPGGPGLGENLGSYRAPVHPAPPRVCVVVRWSCVLQSTQSAE
jgi:hypothetical protein